MVAEKSRGLTPTGTDADGSPSILANHTNNFVGVLAVTRLALPRLNSSLFPLCFFGCSQFSSSSNFSTHSPTFIHHLPFVRDVLNLNTIKLKFGFLKDVVQVSKFLNVKYNFNDIHRTY